MPVTATVVGIAFVLAALILLYMTAKGTGAAALNGIHDLPLFMRQSCAVGTPVIIAITVENIGNLKRESCHSEYLRNTAVVQLEGLVMGADKVTLTGLWSRRLLTSPVLGSGPLS
jgi:hypothetical protein